MKIFRKLVCLVFVALLLLSLSSIMVSASVETYYGDLRISVSTDKNAYSETDIAEITATITNVGNDDANNVNAQVVFDDLAPVGKRTSETSRSVATLKAGESISLKYKATLNAKAHKLSFFQKIILWFKRLFKGGYNASNQNMNFIAQNVTEIKFGKFIAENVVQAECELNKVDDFEDLDDPTYEELIENVDIDEMYEYDDTNRVIDEEYGIEYLDNLIIVMFEDDCTDEEKAEIVNSVNGKVIGGDTLYNELYIEVKSSTLNELEELCEELENHKGVYLASAEEFIYSANSTPTDPWGDVIGNWNADAFGINESNWWALAIKLYSAWSYDEYFSNINIGVADTGFDVSHEDFKSKFTLVSKENSSENHGTHVVGIIGAQHNNEKGLSGVINKCSLFGYDLAKTNGEFKSDTEALKALKVLVEDYKCKVINFSIGTNIYVKDNGCYYDENCKKPITERMVNNWGKEASKKIGKLLEKDDFIVVQSAGNGAKNTKLGIDAVNNGNFCSITKENCYSSNKISKEKIMDRVIIVANANKDKFATDDYSLSADSNGNKNYVDIVAPGISIYSTLAGKEEKHADGTIKYSSGQKYGDMSGTSMAAPMVAGVAGLVWSVNKDFTGSMVKKIITSSAEQGGVLVKDNTASPTTGSFYLVNAKRAVETAIMLTYDTCTVIGSIVDEDENALSGVNIVATNKETGKKICGINYNDGTFSFLLPTGTYNLVFSKYSTEIVIDTEKLNSGDVLDLGEQWLFVGNSIVSGTVTDSQTGKPISDVSIRLVYDDNDTGEYDLSLETDENGGFLKEIRRGNYYFLFEHPDYESKDIKLDISQNETDLGNIELAPKGSGDDDNGNGDDNRPITASGECGADGDNVTWTLYENGELVVSGSGKMENYKYGSSTPWYRKNVTSVVIKEGITSIGNYAFYDCDNLENIILGENIETIGNYSFGYCKLSSVVIPNKVTTIGDYAFWCNRITNLVLGEKVKKIGKYAFHLYKGKNITIPDSVTEIGEEAFSHCYELEELIIGKKVESIGKSAFQQCYGIKNLTIPDNVKTIGEYAFYSCENIITVTIGRNVEFIGKHAFNSISQLEFIVVNENNKEYSSDEYGVLYNKNKTELIQYPIKSSNTVYYIPDSVLKISDSSFYNSDNLIKVIIGNGVTSIERDAFASCDNLQTLVLGSNVSSIGYMAFYHCADLDSIIIPKSIKEIGRDAFNTCMNLKDVYYEGTEEEWNAISIGENAFYRMDGMYSNIHYNS